MPSVRRGISELPYFCHTNGIQHIVISPGSRNAPLTIAFATHPNLTCYSITDERSAAYYGLGMAQQLKSPVVLICTSGTAMINYAPALAEAYYLGVPLIAITADRPPEWIDQNDGQTIRQKNFYCNIIKGSFETPVETQKDEDLWLFRRTISESITLTKSGKPGPVHINVPLREPLYEPLPEVSEKPHTIETISHKTTLAEDQWVDLKKKWTSLKKKLILCGMGDDDLSLSENISQLTYGNEVVVMAENLSNISIPESIESPDRFLAFLNKQQKEEFHPDLLITLGGPVVSKKLKNYLRAFKPTEHWHIGEYDPIIDTFQSLKKNIAIAPDDFFRELLGSGPVNEPYVQFVAKINQQVQTTHETIIQQLPFSDITVYDSIFNHLPANVNLHLANSTPVRYAQLFPNKQGVKYFSNRGTSGIDGCLSTAMGAAMVSTRTQVSIVGDLAFIYDSNALWNNHLPNNIRIIIIDNEGGNIFKLIDTSPLIDPIRHFFETPHKVKIDKLCDAFGVEYFHAQNKEQLESVLESFFKPNDLPAVLHIRTSGDISAKVFKQYYQHISQNNEHDKNMDAS